jgi:hypothetical protein
MALLNLIQYLTGAKKDKFSNNSEYTLNEKIINTMETVLYIFFFFLYITRVDNYIPDTDGFRNILKIIASTFLVLSFMTFILNVVDLFTQ